MLNVHYSIKSEDLVNDFENTVFHSSIWKNPFTPPLIIFPDSKTESWFKLHVISRKNKNSVIMNLKTDRLENFLFESAADGINKDTEEKIWYERLTPEILETYLLNYLISQTGKCYYEKLEKESDILSYIKYKDGSVNQDNLYSFAKNISRLFFDYIDSRNDDLDNGFHNSWNADKSFFSNDSVMENWQRKIYKKLLCDDPLTVKNENKDSCDIQYVTLAQLIEINRKSNGSSLKFNRLNENIFLFGFNSIGQFYRSLIAEISKSTDIHVFLQATDTDCENAANPLLKKWNKTGSDSFGLWKDIVEKNKWQLTHSSKKQDHVQKPTLLGEIQKQIAENKNDSILLNSNDESVTVCGAPSKLKEIEALHSSICKILKQNKDKGLPVSYSDFIVLSPDINEYKVPVMQIFDQVDKYDNKKIDNESKVKFPYIPYVFSDYSGEQSAAAEAMEIFVSILKKNELSRTDLFSILRNPFIKAAKSYSEDEISAWSAWVTNLNGYRNSSNRPEEWKILKDRLLISILTEDKFTLENQTYKLYSDMESQNNESLYKFIDAVDRLENWRTVFAEKIKKNIGLNKDDIKSVQEFLAYWFTLPEDKKKEYSGEALVYSSISKEIRNQSILLSAGFESVNADSFFTSLKENAKGAKGSGASLYVSGITFSKLTQNRTIPAKYVFILGLDSKRFPGKDTELSLDLRNQTEKKKGDSTKSEKNKEAFLCQLMAAEEKLCISYVNKDLKKDSDFFQSSVVDDLLDFISDDEKIKKSISIDEKRKWDELFTQKSFRNKTNFRKTTDNNGHENKNESKSSGCVNAPQKVSISSLKDFLSNPFIFNAKQVFNSKDDEEGENESKQYEPIALDNLTKMDVSNRIIIEILKKLKKDPNPGIKIESDIQEKVQKEIEELKFEHAISDDIFGQVIQKELEVSICSLIGSINDVFKLNKTGFELEKTVALKLECKEYECELSGKLCPYDFDKKKNTLKVMDFVYSKEIKTKHKLKPYLTAIAEIAAEGKDGSPVNVELYIFNGLDKKTISFNGIDRKQAIKILNELLKNMYISPFKKMILINEEIKEDNTDGLPLEPVRVTYDSFGKFLEAVNNSDWQYFSHKELFNPFCDFGFTQTDFKKAPTDQMSGYEKAVDFWKSFVPGLF